MKIVFICGSQEHGKDGVGDYTRRLACELIRQGNEAEIIALYDRYVTSEWKGLQQDNGENVPVLRLPESSSWESRCAAAKALITLYKPDWISLQFVLFTFDKRGLPFGLASKLKPLNAINAKWHVMFHELWVGMDKEAPSKLKLLGVVQKQIVRSFVGKLKLSVVHSHAYVYQQQLKKSGINAKPLPLFTNLFIDETIPRPYANASFEGKQNVVVFSLFGGIHPHAPVNQFADELVTYTKQHNIKPRLKIFGRSGKEQEVWISAMKVRNIEVIVSGELDTNGVTTELFASHYGLATTPMLLADKSSSISTMLGHGLPVICVAKLHEISNIKEDDSIPYLFSYQPGNLSDILNAPRVKAKAPTLLEVASQFTKDLMV